ncbi:MAG: alpha/beta fold hydrolase [Burkholderiales bacterium]|nr:alpha/beta fold hydrolase [Burkholderiales bacterium]
MVAGYIRFQLFLELLAYLAIAYWLHWLLGWGYAPLAAACIAAAIFSRLVMVSITTSIGFAHRSPREKHHHIGPRGTVAMVLREWGSVLMNNFFRFPWPALAVRSDPEPARDGRIPIVMVHGYFSNRGYFGPLVTAMEARGVGPVFAPNFVAAFATIEDFVGQLAGEIERITQATGQPHVILVCHSMGGLAARAYICAHGAARVKKLITIASPHNGTIHARFAAGANGKQMMRASEFLAELCRKEGERGPECGVTSIYSPHDNLVAPQDTSRLPWARNIAIPGRGHVDILASDRLASILLKELRECGVEVRD